MGLGRHRDHREIDDSMVQCPLRVDSRSYGQQSAKVICEFATADTSS